MSLTRGNILDNAALILGDDSTEFRTHLASKLNSVLFAFYDMHDWEFKHKTGTFATVSGTESYTLSTSSTDIRSSQDLEVLYDTTNGRFLTKVDLRDIRKRWPKEDTSGKPQFYAPWGAKTIILSDEPDGIYTMKYLYLAKPTLPTADGNDLESVCGIPDYVHHIIDKMVLAEGMLKYDDSRRTALLQEIGTPQLQHSLIYLAVQADMKHLDAGARFKFWEEEVAATGQSYNDYLRRWWSTPGY